MKRNLLLSSACVLVFLGSSCTISQPLTQNSKANTSTPKFIEGITMNNGSSSIQVNQKKQTYSKPAPIILEEEILEEPEIKYSYKEVLNQIGNNPLQQFITQWYGVPYRLGGTSKFGIDCSAFVQELYGDVYNLPILRTASQQFSSCSLVPEWNNLKEGDLVFFKIKSKRISHVGVYLGNGKFVHASSSKGVMISDLSEKYWTRYFAGGGKVADHQWAQN